LGIMADDSSALMLLLSGDPTLFDIVRLSASNSSSPTRLPGRRKSPCD